MGRTKQPGTSSAAAAETGKEKEKQGEEREGRKGKQRSGREQRKEKEAEIEEQEVEELAVPPAASGEKFFKVFFPVQSTERLVSFLFLVALGLVSLIQ